MEAIFLIIKSRLKHRKILNSLIILLISVSVSVLILALSLCNGFETRLVNKIVSLSSQISIFAEDMPDLYPIKTEINKIIKIKQAEALAANSRNQTVQGVVIKGTSFKNLSKLIQPKYLLIGKYPKDNEIIIGNKLAENLHVNIGDKLQIITDPSSFTELTISGIFKIGLYDFDSGIIIAPESSLTKLSMDSTFGNLKSYYGIWLNNPLKARELAEKLAATNPRISISNWQDDNYALFSAIEVEKKVIFIVLSLLVIIGCMAVSIVQAVQILNKKDQIGILSAIGFTPKKILILYLLEGLTISSIGIISGIILSLTILGYLHLHPIALPIDVYHIENLPITFKIADIFLVSILALTLSAITSFIPAFYASKLSPVEILRN